ncbi:AAA family ATPase [Leucothrix arctica]|uniref:Aminoglycoside phosphotransferase n=1 Tax=Leucothrix arctica TaxID=1481894 RepID=A0A317C695_9GAMM|nr:bifunctional aminoglycoside phosphotransferase/ATP-binding protein [Leucothrix arctica]PWQ93799.1 aminoglycoside phosphotransferase [Leucothrix arctica]
MSHNVQPALIKNLLSNLRQSPETPSPDSVTLLETHISWIILTGSIAYKLKKPVDLGFLNFSTLAQRKYYCEEELRLNARLAPDVYLGVNTVNGSEDKPMIEGDGPVIEYAILMREFPQSAQLDNRLKQGLLSSENMEAIGTMLADFHLQLPPALLTNEYGDLAQIHQLVDDNITVLKAYLSDDETTLSSIEEWIDKQNKALAPFFIQRKQNGFIRECHGDLHLRNLIWIDDHPVAFDCLEFDESLRWIDVMCEVAFLVMDLLSRQQTALAYAFLNQYLQQTGDYAGLALLPYYISYRALVRAKIDALRDQQSGISPQEFKATETELHAYMDLALQISQYKQPTLIITRGLSASGKSSISKPLAAELGAIRIRSDVERKRLNNLKATDSAATTVETGLYSKQATQDTYHRLLEVTEQTLAAGFDVIVDAVFMHKAQRQSFQRLAEKMGYRFVILEFTASVELLKQRIVSRKKEASDADLNVLVHQLRQWQALDSDEANYCLEVSTEVPVDVNALAILTTNFPQH